MKRILLAASALSLVAGAAMAAPGGDHADRSPRAQAQPMQLAQNDRRDGRGGPDRGPQQQPAQPQQAPPAPPAANAPAQPAAQPAPQAAPAQNRGGGRYDPRGGRGGQPQAAAPQAAQPQVQAQPQAPAQPARPQSNGVSTFNGRSYNSNVTPFNGRGGPKSNASRGAPPVNNAPAARGPQGSPPNGQNGRGPQGPQGSQGNRGGGRDGGRIGAAPNNHNWDSSRYGRPVYQNGFTERSRDQGRAWYWPNNWRPSYRAPRIYVYRDWRPPSGFYLRSWTYGDILPFGWYDPPYYLNWAQYGLPIPPVGCEWVRSGSDALLVDVWSGEVLSVEYNLFYY